MTYDSDDRYETKRAQRQADNIRLTIKVVTATTAVVLAIIFLFLLVMPQIRLYRANTEKQAAIAEARAKRDAASFLADAEIERARGVSEANRIIAQSITDEYTRWLYVSNLSELAEKSGATVVYVPTEGGVPVLEAGRIAQQTANN